MCLLLSNIGYVSKECAVGLFIHCLKSPALNVLLDFLNVLVLVKFIVHCLDYFEIKSTQLSFQYYM